jgi:hypothetical protein
MLHTLTKPEFVDLVYNNCEGFLAAIDNFQSFIVRSYFDQGRILALRTLMREIACMFTPSWHPCLDGCPDYHRINDEYPKSWVKARMHSFYFHRWNARRDLFDGFKEIFEMKNWLVGLPADGHYDSTPSSGVISRLVSHQYPRGGGYLAPHVDPASPFARIQTIIQASEYGKDFSVGGLWIQPPALQQPLMIDCLTQLGDLVVASPAVPHGVAPIDPDFPLDWDRTDGRWMILPIVIRSDYNMNPETKPKMLQAGLSTEPG